MYRHLLCLSLLWLSTGLTTAAETTYNLVFLGDQAGHRPAERFSRLAPVLDARGIHMTYTEDVGILSKERLSEYDGLVLYANIDSITRDQADALLEYVASGKAFVPIHSASYCFRNDPRIVALIGAQFRLHGTGEFETEQSSDSHPILDGFGGFASWDETYLHHMHNETDRIVLEYRRGEPQAPGNQREPWTWVRTHGEGRVFYTAWGHDERTWGNPGFQNLIERGIRWACKGDPSVAGPFRSPSADSRPAFTAPQMTKLPPAEGVFDYVDVGPKIPNYAAGGGKTLNLMQKAVPSDESIKRFITPVDFSVKLFADEKIFQAKPIAMNWDEQGRLWVCETIDYPHDLRTDNKGRDRIRILEDTNGDGQADSSIVFAEGLNIPTAIAFHRGGAVVQHGTETLYLKDTNGDGKADFKKVLITGWNLGDTHGGVSNFRNGLDNWIWAMQGYNNSAPKFEGQTKQSFRMGFFRFKLSQSDPPVVEDLEFIRSTTNNTWGLGISEDGLIFGSTANRAPSFFMPIPNRYYERVLGWAPETLSMISDTHLFQPLSDKVRQVDHHGGYTAAAGHAIYTGRTYPSPWWNRTAFVCGPTGKLVGTFVLKPDGAGFRSFSPNNLIASDDEWSAPIMAEVGPDGNVWVIDWYNYIVQHNPTPQGFETGPGNAYLTDLRDKRFGRVYRVVYQDGQSEPAPELARLSIDNVPGLLAGLSHPSMVVRLSAQRLLIERGKTDCVVDLIGLVSDTTVDKIGLNPAAIHAIHTLAGLNALDDEASDAYAAVVAALRHPSAGVRRAAVNRLTDSPVAAKALVDANLLNDSDAQVVLATLLAIADQSSPQLASAVASFVSSDRVNDRWLADASTSAAARHPAKFLGQLASLSSTKPLPAAAYRIARRVAEHFARSESSDSDTQALIQSLAKAETRLIGEVIDGLSAGWPNNRAVALNDQGADLLKQLFRAANDQSKAALVQLAVKWKSDALDPEKAEVSRILLVQVEEEGTPVDQRVSAAERLVALDPSNSMVLDRLAAVVTPLAQPPLVVGLIGAISKSTAPEAADRLIALTEAATPTIRDRAIQTLLSRPSMTQALLSAIEAGEMAISDLTALQRQTLGDHPNREIRQQAQKILASGGGNMNSDRQKLVDDKMHLTAMKGDIEAGKAIFTKNCATCHKYQGEGAVVGPDLTGMSVHPKAELLTHILDPSRSVESNYRLYTVLTADGLVISGLLAGESQTSIEMIDAQAKRHTILREDIEQLVASRKSAMPEGLEESMGDKGIVDLLEFLTAKGEYVPLPIGQVATIVSTKGMFYDAENRTERLVFRDWGPKTFKGVPFILVDPQNGNANNVILLHSNNGTFPPRMPKSVMLPCETGAKRIHLLGGVAGWGATEPRNGGVSMLVRLHYIDGKTEDHPLIDGQHIADYIRIIDVPKSELAFDLNGRQIRYLTIEPKRTDVIKFIEFVKPNNGTAPIVMAVTVQPVSGDH